MPYAIQGQDVHARKVYTFGPRVQSVFCVSRVFLSSPLSSRYSEMFFRVARAGGVPPLARESFCLASLAETATP